MMCAMKIRYELSYDAPVSQVQAMLTDPEFRKRGVLTEEWSADGRASLALHTPGKPTQITGVLTLTQHGARTVEVFEGEAKAKVPLIGGRLEALLADMFRAGLDTEHAVGVSWLKGQRG